MEKDLVRNCKGEWDLTRLVKGNVDLRKKTRALERHSEKLRSLKKYLKNDIKTKRFKEILGSFEDLLSDKAILDGYAYLKYADDTRSEDCMALKTKIEMVTAEVSNSTMFLQAWWEKELDPRDAQRLMKAVPDLAYSLGRSRKTARHSLSEPEEKILSTLAPSGVFALLDIYNRITSGFDYKILTGNKLRVFTREKIMTLTRSDDYALRESAYKTMLCKYCENVGVLGDIYRARVLNWRDEFVGMRNYKSPISVRNLDNDLEDETVAALLKVCVKGAGCFRDFFKIKAREAGMKKLRRYDLFMPIGATSLEGRYTLQQVSEMTLQAWKSFSPKLMSYAKAVFERKHIDYGVRKGKLDEAFSLGITPLITPYVQMSFNGTLSDAMTLAHELGHCMHYAAASKNSILNFDASLPLAEAASKFSEALLFDRIAKGLDAKMLRWLLFKKLDVLYAGIMRPAYSTIFELRAHDSVADGAVSSELNEIYFDMLTEQFAGSIELNKEFEVEWSSILHFYESPFYCYAYSFGNLLALAFFQRYKEEGKSFVKDYEEILSAGGSKNPQKLLEDHGFDVTSPRLWADGFDYIKERVCALDRM